MLLKHGRMEVFECCRAELFELALRREAGICGVFEQNDDAERFALKSFKELHRDSSNGVSSPREP